MIDINLIRKDPQFVKDALKRKGKDVDFTDFLEKDKQARELENQTNNLKAKKNEVSDSIAKLKKEGKDVQGTIKEMKELGVEIAENDKKLKELQDYLRNFIAVLPNLPDPDVVAGGKENNQKLRSFGEKPTFDFEPKNHVDLCESCGLIDYKRGVKLAGNGYWIYTNVGARLEWAILNYFISTHLKDGYCFILPPHMLSYDCGFGAGQFPKFADEVYWIKDDDGSCKQFLLPTAETALVNLHAGEILSESDLPKKYFAYTPCYRKEAGSYRSEERGMIRGHQFNKVEMVQYTTKETSMKAFEELVNKAEKLVQGLELHYQVSKLAAEDCSASMARTYDIEVWIPSMNIYKEVSSASNANDYQARRNNTKYRTKDGKTEFVHTLNASGLATSRIIPALVEQHQQADGSIKIPKALVPFFGEEYIYPIKK